MDITLPRLLWGFCFGFVALHVFVHVCRTFLGFSCVSLLFRPMQASVLIAPLCITRIYLFSSKRRIWPTRKAGSQALSSHHMYYIRRAPEASNYENVVQAQNHSLTQISSIVRMISKHNLKVSTNRIFLLPSYSIFAYYQPGTYSTSCCKLV